MRRWLAWPIAVPLAVIGTLSGHAVGYRAAVPDAHVRSDVLMSSGHGYLEYAPLVIALCVAAAGLGFVALLVAAVRGHGNRSVQRPFKLVAALAPAAFVLQELLERYAHDGRVDASIVLSAPFLLGLATQVPFALLAAAIAIALTAAATRVAGALRPARLPRRQALAIRPLLWLAVDLPSEPGLARGYTGRGPPLLA